MQVVQLFAFTVKALFTNVFVLVEASLATTLNVYEPAASDSNFIDEAKYQELNNSCTQIRVMLIKSINTAKGDEKWKNIFIYA